MQSCTTLALTSDKYELLQQVPDMRSAVLLLFPQPCTSHTVVAEFLSQETWKKILLSPKDGVGEAVAVVFYGAEPAAA